MATRGGVRRSWSEADGAITVEMGRPTLLDAAPSVSVSGWDSPRPGIAVTVPNPHVVVDVDEADLAALDLSVAPRVAPALPDGQNVEFVARLGARHLALRVHERGVGETRSCGTGICAAVVAAHGALADGSVWTVEVPGGRCQVRWRADGELLLTGPAVLVASVDLDAEWLAAARGPAAMVRG
jgi:diaminopimelate epimerase